MKTISKLLSVVLVSVLLSGCFDDVVKVYEGPAVVEFAQYDQPFSPGLNYIATATFPADATDSAADFSLKLQLISEHFSSDTHINVTVAQDLVNAQGDVVRSTTAQQGVHYQIMNTDGRAVFPANSSFSTVDLRIFSAGLAPGQQVQVILELTEGDQLLPSANHRYYTVRVGKAAS
ncbi:MAG: hypothetical protein ABR545_12320 [Cyclonatronaceae bacterium]